MRNKEEKKINNNILMFTIISIVFSIGIFSFKTISNANDNHIYVKQFNTIEIQPGDTLTKIANENACGTDLNNYIKEIKYINNLDSDIIHEGCYLVIPVYEIIEKNS